MSDQQAQQPQRFNEPDWDLIATDVLKKLGYLKAIWRGTKDQVGDQAHQVMCRDLFIPALAPLMEFCDAVSIEDEQE